MFFKPGVGVNPFANAANHNLVIAKTRNYARHK